MKRRDFLAALAAAGAAGAIPARALAQAAAAEPVVRKGRIKQGLWTVNFGASGGQNASPSAFTVDQMAAEGARLGVKGFDLVQRAELPTLQKHGLKLICTNGGDMDFLTGVIHPEAFDRAEAALKATADFCADNGVRGIALNAGELRGLSFDDALDNAVTLCNRVKAHMEERGVEMWIENVNDHRPDEPGLGRSDMAFGHWDWGIELCERVNSPGVKLLCDLYHLQIMDGDLAYRIKRDLQWIGHFHVAGVPTRNEIDGTQEVNFRYIAEVIAATDYDGYVSHEWRPAPGRDALESLAQCVEIMDV